MTVSNCIKDLLDKKAFHLQATDYDAIFENPQDIFLLAFTDQPSLNLLSKEIWNVKANKKRLYQCFTTLFNSPIYKAALEYQATSDVTKVLKVLKDMNQSEIVALWMKPVMPTSMQCILVIIKHMLLQKKYQEEIVILLLFRPLLMQELAMREKSEQYVKTQKYLDTIEVSCFFGKFNFSKTSMTEFHEKLVQDKELYSFFMNAVRKELGLGRDATEEETFGYLESTDITKLATAIVNEMKKDPKKGQYYVGRFKKFLEENLPEDLKQSLQDNPITNSILKTVIRG
ncbi:MAG: hypothetical protein EOP45_12595 [Sphingobacteriaceae bacterium]|nr:MAG: hypothetical protein EOP45_12595 [Sphingobacteriaceae bacterium]